MINVKCMRWKGYTEELYNKDGKTSDKLYYRTGLPGTLFSFPLLHITYDVMVIKEAFEEQLGGKWYDNKAIVASLERSAIASDES